jgi:hypothetical protein
LGRRYFARHRLAAAGPVGPDGPVGPNGVPADSADSAAHRPITDIRVGIDRRGGRSPDRRNATPDGVVRCTGRTTLTDSRQSTGAGDDQAPDVARE